MAELTEDERDTLALLDLAQTAAERDVELLHTFALFTPTHRASIVTMFRGMYMEGALSVLQLVKRIQKQA